MKYSMEFVKNEEPIEDSGTIIHVPPSRSDSQSNKERFETVKAHYKKLLIKQEISRKENEKLIERFYRN